MCSHGQLDEKPFTCKKCGVSFRRNILLKNHIVTESCEKYISKEEYMILKGTFPGRGRPPVKDSEERSLNTELKGGS